MDNGGVDQEVIAILRRDNGWLGNRRALRSWLDDHVPTPFVTRAAVEDNAANWNRMDRAHLVVGPRQAGKSTAIWSHLVGQEEPVLFIDCELRPMREWCKTAPLFLADLDELVGAPVPLFFEEIQHLEEAGLFLKGLEDRRPGVPIFVTGSSAYHLRSKTRESLAGRATRTRLLPFSLAEVTDDLGSEPPALRRALVQERLDRHVIFGGYPDVWLADDPGQILGELAAALAMPDGSELERIAKPEALRKLLRLIARQVGSLINLSEWASLLGISRPTVGAYLELLVDAHLVGLVLPFTGGRRSELTSRPKVYLLDNGLRNWLAGDLRPFDQIADPGPLLENWVYTELLKVLPDDRAIHFWRSTAGAEVDFVVAGPKDRVAVEVKAGRMNRPKLPRACRSFIEAYGPRRMLLVNRTLDHTERLGETEVCWTPLVDLVERLSG